MNNEPAFPVPSPNNDGWYSGMMLRDYFAALAMQGIIAHPHGKAGMWDESAKDAYAAADSMLEARK